MKEKETVQKMFNDISSRYDFLNHFLSLGIDILWRKKFVRILSGYKPSRILDVATGTGDRIDDHAGVVVERGDNGGGVDVG